MPVTENGQTICSKNLLSFKLVSFILDGLIREPVIYLVIKRTIWPKKLGNWDWSTFVLSSKTQVEKEKFSHNNFNFFRSYSLENSLKLKNYKSGFQDIWAWAYANNNHQQNRSSQIVNATQQISTNWALYLGVGLEQKIINTISLGSSYG